MKAFDVLTSIILNEAPISSYVKSFAKKAVSPSAYLKGASNVLSGAQKAASMFTTSTKSLQDTLGGAANVTSKLGSVASDTGKWLRDPLKKNNWWEDGDDINDIDKKAPRVGSKLNVMFNKQPGISTNLTVTGKVVKKIKRPNKLVYRILLPKNQSGANMLEVLFYQNGRTVTTLYKDNKPLSKPNNNSMLTPTANKNIWTLSI